MDRHAMVVVDEGVVITRDDITRWNLMGNPLRAIGDVSTMMLGGFYFSSAVSLACCHSNDSVHNNVIPIGDIV